MSEQLEYLQDKLIRLGDRVVDGANIAIDKMPEVYQQLYQAKVLRMQVEACMTLAATLLVFVASLVAIYVLVRVIILKRRTWMEDMLFFPILGLGVCGVIAVCAGVRLLSGELWLCLFAPEVVLWSNFLDGITGSMLK